MSVSELTMMAHRRGFQTLDEVDQCVLEPGGTFKMVRKAANGNEAQILTRLEQILGELRQLEVIRPKGSK